MTRSDQRRGSSKGAEPPDKNVMNTQDWHHWKRAAWRDGSIDMYMFVDGSQEIERREFAKAHAEGPLHGDGLPVLL